MSNGWHDQYGDDPAVTRVLRERLPRHPAPPALRAAVRRLLDPEPSPSWWRDWLRPTLAAAATAMVMVLWATHRLTGVPGTTDPVQALVRSAVSEYARTVSFRDGDPEMLPAVLPRVMDESGVILRWVFTGDADLQLVDAHSTYIDGHRGLTLTYLERGEIPIIYTAIPGGSAVLPEGARVQVGRWRPVIRQESGFTVIMWNQQDLLFMLVGAVVADNEVARLKDYFVRMRSSTDRFAAF